MRRFVAISVAFMGVAVGQVHCGTDTRFDSTTQAPAVGGGGSAGAAGAGGVGGGAACTSFGDPCTTCAVSPNGCSDSYCACLASTECSALWQCVLACDMGDADCIDGCELSNADGYAELLQMLDCFGQQCSAQCGGLMPYGVCAECFLDACDVSLEACVGDGDCNEYLDCVFGCMTPGCYAACYLALPDTTLADAFGACIQTSCSMECGQSGQCAPLGDMCTQCAFDSAICNASYCGCLSDPDCSAYAQCVNGCAPSDETCNDACELTYGAGYSAFYQMAACMGSECTADCGFGPLPDCFTCLAGSCAVQLDACQLDAECNQFLDCSGACMGNQACQAQCYAAMTDTTEADALFTCLGTSCGTACGSSGAGGGMPSSVGVGGSFVTGVGVGGSFVAGVGVGGSFVTVTAGN